MKGYDKLYSGQFNNMSVEIQPDGSQIITLSSYGEDKCYVLHVRNLYAEDEEVLDYKEIKISTPQHILTRMAKTTLALPLTADKILPPPDNTIIGGINERV
jgi:hypothetical protein